MSYLWLVLSACCSVIASIALKIGAYSNVAGGRSALSFSGMLPYAVAIGSYGLGFALYAVALRRLELSLAYPMMVSISIAGVVGYGIFFGAEAVTAWRIVGAAMIAGGLFFLVR